MAVKAKQQSMKLEKTRMDTISITPAIVQSWKDPPFQRQKTLNSRVKEVLADLKNNGGVLPGVITLGVYKDDVYLVDGQHRAEAFLLSGCTDGMADVRYYYSDINGMAEEYIRLNSHLVGLRTDNFLKAWEHKYPVLGYIRAQAPFVGYEYIRRGNVENRLAVAMSVALRCWYDSGKECPSGGGVSAASIVPSMTQENASQLVVFLNMVERAWGKDPEYARLWGKLNLTICMWIYRRVVLGHDDTVKKSRMTPATFERCAMQLSADSRYLDWLTSRQLVDRDRAPAYRRIKTMFVRVASEGQGKKIYMPAPSWVTYLSPKGKECL